LGNQNGQKYAAGLSTFNRWGEPKDVADIVAFLASSDRCWITGELIDESGRSFL
jgi:3-oxoacyl-[acyl-carrier protein] reductase